MTEQDTLNLLFRIGRAMEQLHQEKVPGPVLDRIAKDMINGAFKDDACPPMPNGMCKGVRHGRGL